LTALFTRLRELWYEEQPWREVEGTVCHIFLGWEVFGFKVGPVEAQPEGVVTELHLELRSTMGNDNKILFGNRDDLSYLSKGHALPDSGRQLYCIGWWNLKP
jgi:hypothetical protein